MGYKLAGWDVVGFVEIDPKMAACYSANMPGTVPHVMPIDKFTESLKGGISDDLRDLDLLDGSPPCSTFSMAGKRDKVWGKAKKFREGQATQVLDSLPFDMIELAAALRPKVVVMENVEGLVRGNAKGFARMIVERLGSAGYTVQVFVLDASRMGVPQNRRRAFFIGRRDDMALGKLALSFDEPITTASQAIDGVPHDGKAFNIGLMRSQWGKTMPGDSFVKQDPRGYHFNWYKQAPNVPFRTITATNLGFHWCEPRHFSEAEIGRAQTFPDDYKYEGVTADYACGMSVPPRMMQRLSLRLAEWIKGGACPPPSTKGC
jgi:DNA (cytosine-5)-methyltransferase 1